MRTACHSVLQQEEAKPRVEKWCIYGFNGSVLIQELITADVITAATLTLIPAGLGEKMMLLLLWKYHQVMFITCSQSSHFFFCSSELKRKNVPNCLMLLLVKLILVSAHKPELECRECPPRLFASADKIRSTTSSCDMRKSASIH